MSRPPVRLEPLEFKVGGSEPTEVLGPQPGQRGPIQLDLPPLRYKATEPPELQQSTRLALGLSALRAGRAIGPRPEVTPFNDLAASLDPLLPLEDYEAIRDEYFRTTVAPYIENPVAIPEMFEQFKQDTMRPEILTGLEKRLLQSELAINSAARAFAAPLTAIDEGAQAGHDKLVERNAVLERIARREGLSVMIPEISGELVGMLPGTILALATAGPVAGGVAAKAFSNARTVQLAGRALRGGIAFGAYEAAADQQGDRLMAGLWGFGLGAATDGLLGLPAFLRARGVVKTLDEGEAAARAVMSGETVSKEVDNAAAEYVEQQAKTSRAEGRPNAFLEENDSRKGLWALVEDPDGRTLPIEIRRGQEDAALNRINQLLDKGGSVDTFQWHSEDAGRAQKFIRSFGDTHNQKYDESVFVRVQEGRIPQEVADELLEQGLPAEVRADGEISIPAQRIRIETPEETAAQRLRPVTPAQEIDEIVTKADLSTRAVQKRAMGEAPAMTVQEAEEFATRMGFDPATTDIEMLRYTGKEEVERLIQVVEQQRANAGGASEQAASDILTKGDEAAGSIDFHPQAVLWTEGTERELAGQRLGAMFDKITGNRAGVVNITDLNLKTRRGQITAVVDENIMRKVREVTGGDPLAVTARQWAKVLQDIGVPAEQIEKAMLPNAPLVIYGPQSTRTAIYHEGLHANMVNAEINPMRMVPKEFRGIAAEMAAGLGGRSGYQGMKMDNLLNEVYTYLAQAIRFGDEQMLNRFAMWDRDRQHIVEFMNEMSHSLKRATMEKLDRPGVRIFQRRLDDIIRRTDDDIFEMAQQGRRLDGGFLDFDSEIGTWTLRTSEGPVQFEDLNKAWDWFEANDMSDYLADPSMYLQTGGLRGPFIPPGMEPGKRRPLPDFSLDQPGMKRGVLAAVGPLAPTLPWVAAVDRRLNTIAAKGAAEFPLWRATRNVDQAMRAGDDFLVNFRRRFGEPLSRVDRDKQKTLFELLSHPRETWERNMAKLRLNEDDLAAADEILDVAKDFAGETGINVERYLKDFYPRLKHNAYQVDSVPGWGILKNPDQMGFWERALVEGKLDAQETYAPKFFNWVVREGFDKKFTAEPLKELERLVNLKAKDGGYVMGAYRWPMTNYVNYVKGLPDPSQQMITRLVGDFQTGLADRFKAINARLPKWGRVLPEEFEGPQAAVNKLMVMSYAAGLGARPAVTARDTLQVFMTGGPIFGHGKILKGLAQAFSKERRDFAKNNGWLLKKETIGDVYGDIFQELPVGGSGRVDKLVQLSNKLLAPARWGNQVARAVVGNTAYDDAVKALANLRRTGDQAKFISESNLWATEPQFYSDILAQAVKPGADDTGLAIKIATELVETTQWPYRRGTQAPVFRTGAGRILGQYGSWPSNYAAFLTNMQSKRALFPRETMKAGARWAGINYAAASAMGAAGVDWGKWLFMSPASYTGGPHLELLKDLMLATEIGTREGPAARARILRYPMNFVPAGVQLRYMINAWNDDLDMTPGGDGFLRLLGFRPQDDLENDADLQEWLLEESGLTASPFVR